MFMNRVSPLLLGFGIFALTGCATMSLSETGASSSDRVAESQTGDYSVLDCNGILAVADLVKLRLDLARSSGQPINLLAVQMQQVAKQGKAQSCPRVAQVVADAGNISAFDNIAFNTGVAVADEIESIGDADQPAPVIAIPIAKQAVEPVAQVETEIQPVAVQSGQIQRKPVSVTPSAQIVLGDTIVASTDTKAAAVWKKPSGLSVGGGQFLQVGVFFDPQNVKAAIFYFKAQGFTAHSRQGDPSDENVLRVLVGPFAGSVDMERARQAAVEIGLTGSYIVTQ
jgi:cell division septation protein DedD